MKETYPDNKYADKTWRSYTIRLIRWLELTGFLQPATEPNTWIYKDLGSPKTSVMSRRRTSNFLCQELHLSYLYRYILRLQVRIFKN